MVSLHLFIAPAITAPSFDSFRNSKIYSKTLNYTTPALNFQVPSLSKTPRPPYISIRRPHAYSDPQVDGEEESEDSVQEIRVPNHWLNSSKALEESEWLRVTLHKWLDDEYCPEPTNVEISKAAAHSYYKSLMQNQTDLGEILLKMAIELESISYQESFHGAFSSANAAVNLILQRIVQLTA